MESLHGRACQASNGTGSRSTDRRQFIQAWGVHDRQPCGPVNGHREGHITAVVNAAFIPALPRCCPSDSIRYHGRPRIRSRLHHRTEGHPRRAAGHELHGTGGARALWNKGAACRATQRTAPMSDQDTPFGRQVCQRSPSDRPRSPVAGLFWSCIRSCGTESDRSCHERLGALVMPIRVWLTVTSKRATGRRRPAPRIEDRSFATRVRGQAAEQADVVPPA